MPGTTTPAHWSIEACKGVSRPTNAPRVTPAAGHAGVRCVDYDDHDTTVNGKIHSCHWCYEKVNSHEFINGDWLSASFNVHMDIVQNNGQGMRVPMIVALGLCLCVRALPARPTQRTVRARQAARPQRQSPGSKLAPAVVASKAVGLCVFAVVRTQVPPRPDDGPGQGQQHGLV